MTLSYGSALGASLELQVHKVTGGLEPPLVPLTRRVRCQLRHVTERPRGDSNSRFPDLQSRALRSSGFEADLTKTATNQFGDEMNSLDLSEPLATGPEAEAVGLEPTQLLSWTP